MALTRRLRSSSAAAASSLERERAEAEDRARRADDAIEPGRRKLVEVGAHLAVEVLHQPALVARRQRVGLDEPLGQADDAELEALARVRLRRGAERDLDAAAADVDDDRRAAADVDAVARPRDG